MAINKKLIYYNRTLENFKKDSNGLANKTTLDTDGNVGNIPYRSIVFLSDGYIWTHGQIFDCHNTWRSVVDNLTSTSTTDSLSANLGRILNNKFSSYLPLTGGTITNTDSEVPLAIKGKGTYSAIKFVDNQSSAKYRVFGIHNGNLFVTDDTGWNKEYTIYHSGNLPAYPTKASWNYDDVYVKLNSSITNLPKDGGIYWNPYIESATDGSDVASIVLKTGTKIGSTTLGTVLTISLMNDANDTILFLTNTSANLYHNTSKIWTEANDGSNSGLDADLLDGYHASSFYKWSDLENNTAKISKTYTSASYYATSSGDYNTSTWYFMKIKPDSQYKSWKVRFKIRSVVASATNADSTTWSEISGRYTDMIYHNFNERYDAAHYYIVGRALNTTGFSNGQSHAIGISIIYGWNYTNSSYPRTFYVDYYGCEGCTVEILDTPIPWSSWANNANYGGVLALDAINRGLRETSDDNDTQTLQKYYSRIIAGANGIQLYSLVMLDNVGRWLSLTTNNGTGTKTRNTVGFNPNQVIYMNTSSNYTNGQIVGFGSYRIALDLIDARYSFNIVAGGSGLYADKPTFIVGTIKQDGLFYLDTTWWTLTIPTSEDGKVYIKISDGCYYDYSSTVLANYRIDFYYGGLFEYKNGSFGPVCVANHIRSNMITSVASEYVADTTYSHPGGGYRSIKNPNIRLIGDPTYGLSTIEFVSLKGDTTINKPSDCAYIQFLPYGNTPAAISSGPTLNTSGEVNRFILGVNNDSNDEVWILTPGGSGLKHVVGTSVYSIYDSGNLAFSNGLSLSSGTVSNSGVRSTTINGNYLRVNTGGTNTDLTIPYATNTDTVDSFHITDWGYPYLKKSSAKTTTTLKTLYVTIQMSGYSAWNSMGVECSYNNAWHKLRIYKVGFSDGIFVIPEDQNGGVFTDICYDAIYHSTTHKATLYLQLKPILDSTTSHYSPSSEATVYVYGLELATITISQTKPTLSANKEWKAINSKVLVTNPMSADVSYATIAGSATDSTKLPLSGGTLTGKLTTDDVLVPYGKKLITAGDWTNNNGLYMYEGSDTTTYGGYILYGASDKIHIGTWNNSTTGTDALTISRGSSNVNILGALTVGKKDETASLRIIRAYDGSADTYYTIGSKGASGVDAYTMRLQNVSGGTGTSALDLQGGNVVAYDRLGVNGSNNSYTFYSNGSAYINGATTIKGLTSIQKDLGGTLTNWGAGGTNDKQHSGPFEVGRASDNWRVTIGVADPFTANGTNAIGYIQTKGSGISTPGWLVLNPAGNFTGNDKDGKSCTGSVGIGIKTPPHYMLEVGGTLGVAGATTINSNLSVSSSSSFAGHVVFKGATSNGYSTGAIEVQGNGSTNTIYPSLGFHQPGKYAGYIKLTDWGQFELVDEGHSKANLTSLTFTSNIATGTAPFTITSTTKVNNLNADLLDGEHASSFVHKKWDNGHYPYIGSAVGSAWYKVTLPYDGASSKYTGNAWEMVSFDVHIGDSYDGQRGLGVCHVEYYFLWNSTNKKYTATNVKGLFIAPSDNTSIEIRYNLSNPAVFFISVASGVYNGISILNLFNHDTSRSRDYGTTKIETIASNNVPGVDNSTYFSVPISKISNTKIATWDTVGSRLLQTGNKDSGQLLIYSSSDSTYGGGIQIRERGAVTNTLTAWSYAPRITFHWGNTQVKTFGMRSDGQMAVNDSPIALISDIATNLPTRLLEYRTTGETDENATTSGFHYMNTSASPFVGTDWTARNGHMLTVNSYSTSWVNLIALNFYAPEIAIRNKQNGTWGDWGYVELCPYIMSSKIRYSSYNRGFRKIEGNNSWTDQVYSKTGYRDNCYVSWKIGQTNAYIMVGLNSDPKTDASYTSIDFCWYMQSGGGLNMCESGSGISSIAGHTTYAVGDEFRIEYSSGTIKYYHNGILCRSKDRNISGLLYVDSSFHSNGYIYDVEFGLLPTIAGKSLLNGSHNLDSIADGVYYHCNTDVPTNYKGNNAAIIQYSGRLTIEKFQLSFSSNDKCIYFRNNGLNSGWVAWEKILTSANFTSGTGASNWCAGNDSRLSDARPANGGSATSASYIKSISYSSSSNTVASYKTAIHDTLNANSGIGRHLIVTDSVIGNWETDTATVSATSVASIIHINGGYDGHTYGQYLVASWTYGLGMLQYSNGFGSIKWFLTGKYVLFGGNDIGLGASSPAATAKTYWSDANKVPDSSIKLYLNSNGAEYTLLFSKRGTYGSILRWGYADKYIYILRNQNNSWKSDDWEKVSAGYADSAGSAGSASKLYSVRNGTAAWTHTQRSGAAELKLFCTAGDTATDSPGKYTVGFTIESYYGLSLAAYGGEDSTIFYIRNNNNTWRTLIHSGNIGSLSVSYASSAGSAGSVAWSNITSKPTLPNFVTYTGSLASGGWKALNGKANSPSIAISYNNAPATWNSGTYSATLVYGCNDTRGLLDCAYNSPMVTFGGCSYGGATDDAPAWYFKLSGTTATTYNLNTFATAYGWGNHANAGYLKSHLDISGKVDKTSTNRPGVVRLYRRDADNNYSVQTDWTGTYWRLRGYSGDNFHGECLVGYATSAGSASTATTATNANNLYVTEHASNNTTYYPLWANGTGGANRTIYVTKDKLQFVPATGALKATAMYALSDIRFKNIYNYINISISDIANLPIFDFTWSNGSIGQHSGTSALEVLKILPNLVTENDQNKLVLNYASLGTIEGIICARELIRHEDEILTLKNRIKELEEKLMMYGR